MRKIENCKIEYFGFEEPQTPGEIDLEIHGLNVAIAECNKRIATLKQSLLLAKMVAEELNNDNNG